jgi:two-component system, LytTR family, sensor kinase
VFGIRYRYLFVLFLTVYSYINLQLTVGESLLTKQFSGAYLFLALGIVVLFLWELNRISESVLGKIQSSIDIVKKAHPLIILFLLSLVNVIIASAVSLVVMDILLHVPVIVDYDNTKLLMGFGFRVNLFLHCINAIVFFMNKLKKAQLETEHLKKITMEAQFEALRNQINPHFMFNCFNVLSTLVYKDPDASAKFITQISNVYRYLLNSQERKVVSLQDELSFMESYLYLLQIRYGENLIVQKEINASPTDRYIAPAALQMLIENAIKHNVVSKTNPLTIKIFSTPNAIVVTNNLQEKQVKEESTNRGLQNIQSRYQLLSDDPVIVDKTETEFRVQIPLLQLAEI